MTALLRFAHAQTEPPVLYPQTDAAVLLTSRYRDELRRGFRFILADAELIEQLVVDKARFQLLADAYMDGTSLRVWLRWASRCEAVSGLSRDDPLPFLRGTLWGAIRRRLPRPAGARRRIGARDAP